MDAHPGIGLVIDRAGNIYYTDLKNIWKQSPDGRKRIVVEGVHSHELYMDSEDQLYGEHLWYKPEEDQFYQYHWCLQNNGKLTLL